MYCVYCVCACVCVCLCVYVCVYVCVCVCARAPATAGGAYPNTRADNFGDGWRQRGQRGRALARQVCPRLHYRLLTLCPGAYRSCAPEPTDALAYTIAY